MSLKTKEDCDSIINKESSTIARKCLPIEPPSSSIVFSFIALQCTDQIL
jgi:hypothetical protein